MAAFLKCSLLLVLLLALCDGAPLDGDLKPAENQGAAAGGVTQPQGTNATDKVPKPDEGKTATIKADPSVVGPAASAPPASPSVKVELSTDPVRSPTTTEVPTTVKEATEAAQEESASASGSGRKNSANQIAEAFIPVILALHWI